ncbi:DNA cytosine methyltransferase [Noviherbaspirillum sp. UKPF54]|uniref:DNA cytosine methyltransferase n=1 Tax=Noviherbaspirillum sp. UKPF54 TaxID=2601898 RepID=UPI0011B15C8A|nr:DNA cytosine methyltransferase [Noviherbaspirillum sp. UKPF54]QDZ29571.1 DNA cytosine methyltransferase [Noviherbaspirillum sp. UKPF54]
MKYTCIDSFAGAGGLSLGLTNAGFDVLLSFDFDAHCIATQNLNKKRLRHPARQADVNDLLGGALLRELNLEQGELFLLAGGPPCQGFSVQRIGNDRDARNTLVSSYFKLVDEVRPAYFLMENVPGITGKRGRLILDKEIERVTKLGYAVHCKTLDAQDFGVPQRRRRVFFVGERLDGYLPTFEFPAPMRGKKITVREVIGHLPPPPLDGSEHPTIVHHRSDKLSELNKKRLAALPPGKGRDHLPPELLADCHKISSSIIGHRNVYGKMAWDEVAPTITARFDSFTRGLFGHPEQLRTISLREGALLQTFPQDFVFSGSKVDIARQIGNAVPVKLAEVLGRQIISCHSIKAKQYDLSDAVS